MSVCAGRFEVVAQATVTFSTWCCTLTARSVNPNYDVSDFVGKIVTIDNKTAPVFPTKEYLFSNSMVLMGNARNGPKYNYLTYSSYAADYATHPNLSDFSIGADTNSSYSSAVMTAYECVPGSPSDTAEAVGRILLSVALPVVLVIILFVVLARRCNRDVAAPKFSSVTHTKVVEG